MHSHDSCELRHKSSYSLLRDTRKMCDDNEEEEEEGKAASMYCCFVGDKHWVISTLSSVSHEACQ